MLKIISREDAAKDGLLRYFSGVPCRHFHVAERHVSTGRCVECERLRHHKYNQEKSLDPAWRKAQSKRAHGWNKRNRERKNLNNKKYRNANIEKVTASYNRWRSQNVDWVFAYNKAYRQNNPDKFREADRRRRARNPELAAERLKRLAVSKYKDASKTNRRARVKRTSGRMTSAELAALRDSAGGRCPNCGNIAALEFDHVVPLSKGGTHTFGNIQMLCRPCNLDKGTKEPVEWAWTNKRRRH